MADLTLNGGEIVFPKLRDDGAALESGDTFTYTNSATFPETETKYIWDSNYRTWTTEGGVGGEIEVPKPDNLVIGQGTITAISNFGDGPDGTDADGFIGQTVIGTATITGEEGTPNYYHNWYVDGQLVDTFATTDATNNYELKSAGKLTYRLGVTDSAHIDSIKFGDLSDEFLVKKPEKNYTMNGLRFDEDRETHMGRSTISDVTGDWSVSFWYKFVDGGSPKSVYFLSDNGKTGINISNSSRNINFWDGATNHQLTSSVTENQWAHIFIKYSSNKMTGYLNGVEENTKSITNGTFTSFTLGTYTDNYLNGYLSDFYFVDGQALPPTTFGMDDGGKWAPVETKTILQTINNGTKSPYDQRPNMDEEWSAVLTTLNPWQSNRDQTKAFDGDLTTKAATDTIGDVLTWAVPSGLSGAIEIYAISSKQKANGESLVLNNWTKLSTLAENTASIEFSADGQKAELTAIRIDGRILVDGPADNSAVWSDDVRDPVENDSPKQYGFDGSTSTNTRSTGDTLYWDTTLTNVTSLKIRLRNDSFNTPGGGDSNYVTVSGSGITSTNININDAKNLIDIPLTDSNVSSISLTTSDRLAIISGICQVELNGKVLVDSGRQWNTSQVWSNTLGEPRSTSEAATMAFDGRDDTDFVSVDIDPLVWNITLDNVETLDIQLRRTSQAINSTLTVTGDNITSTSIVNNEANKLMPITITNPGNSVGNISITSSDTGTGAPGIAMVRVNGEVLVDGGSFGDNGFYLPFDPAATGQIWSSQLSDGATFVKNYGPEKAFNGLTVTDGGRAVPSTASVIFNFGGIPITTGLSISVGSDGSGVDTSATFKVNGVDVKSQVSAWQKAHTEFTAITGFTQLDTIEIGKDSDAAYTSLYGVKVDGKLLIDHNNIGVDASGNGNNFHDQNFVVGNTSQVWSSLIQGTIDTQFNSDTKSAFNGVVGTSYTDGIRPKNGDTNGLLIDFGGIPCTTLEIDSYLGFEGVASNPIKVNGVEINTPSGSEGFNHFSYTVPGGILNTYQWFCWSGGFASDGYSYLNGLTVDGKLLVDGNIQDTVKDSPMTNYAVMDGPDLQNGNLVASGTSRYAGKQTIKIPPTGRYYMEISPIDISLSSGYTVGFYSDDLPDDWVGKTPYEVGYYIDGRKYTNHTPTDYGDAYASGDVLGTIIDFDAETFRFFVNNTAQPVLQFSLFDQIDWNNVNFGAGPTNLNGVYTKTSFNFGQQTFAYATDNGDGTVTLDGDVYNTLYQTFDEWARSTTGYMQDRISELETRAAARATSFSALQARVEALES